MSKGKYKRKRERRRAAQQNPPNPGLAECSQQTKDAETAEAAGQDKKDPPMGIGKRLGEMWNACSLTDRIITAFTGVLAVTAIYQFIVTNGQLEAMRIDERAWLKPEAAVDKLGDEKVSWQIVAGQPVTYPLRVENTGKTPASNVDMKIFVEIVKADQEPPLDHVDAISGYPYGRIVAGIIFPNSDFKQVVTRPSENGTAQLATQDEVEAVRDGRAYLAVFGIVKYEDVFKTPRWTKFCSWIAMNGTFQAQNCTRYNAVDNN